MLTVFKENWEFKKPVQFKLRLHGFLAVGLYNFLSFSVVACHQNFHLPVVTALPVPSQPHLKSV